MLNSPILGPRKNKSPFFALSKSDLKSLNKEATCYKNPVKPSCIDLILTNSPRSFLIQKLVLRSYQTATNQSYLFFRKYFPK